MKGVLLTILTSVVVVLMCGLGVLIGEQLWKPLAENMNDGVRFAISYGECIGIWVVILLAGLIGKKNRKDFAKFKFNKERVKITWILGLTMGFGLNFFLAVLAMLHGDIKLHFNEFNIGMVLLFIVCVAIQSGAEEVACRWFLYERLRKYFPQWPIVAVLVNSVVFGFAHIGNDGVTVLAITDLILNGILFSLIVYYFDSFWGAVIAHTGWNFCQSIFLGLPNSGLVSAYSVFQLDAANARNSIFYNVGFGIEGTVMSNIAFILACVLVFWIGRKYKARKQAQA